MTDAFAWPGVLNTLLGGEDLTEDQAGAAMAQIMEGSATPSQIAAFVVALKAKGETESELTGLVRTMRRFSEKVEVDGDVLDTCGTGGDRSGTFNVSTAAALVCAGAGVRVAKHGNRAASSRCGSADVFEALGVRIDLPAEGVARCIEEAGMGFCFAPVFHPALRHAAPTRAELGIATIFNFVGPLANPAGATCQTLGVADDAKLEMMVATLARLGSKRVIAFRGSDGLDELTLAGPSRVVELKEGQTTEWTVDPSDLGLEPATAEDLAGGDAVDNAAAIRSVLAGNAGPARDVVVLNAAAGLLAADRVQDLSAGLEAARVAIDSGAAADSLERLVKVSSSL